MSHLFRILLDPKGEGEGAAPSGQGAVGDPSEGFRKLLEKTNNDAVRLAETLYGENYTLRDKLRTLTGKVPAEGDVVLSGDDAKRWHTYRELGEPTELRKAVSERDQFRAESESFRRAEGYDAVAARNNLNPKVFRRLAEQEKLQLEARDVRGQDGKLAPVDHVKGVDADGKEVLVPLSDYIDRSLPEFIPALREGQKVEPPPRPRTMPPRREPSPVPPPPDDGTNPIHRETQAHHGYLPM